MAAALRGVTVSDFTSFQQGPNAMMILHPGAPRELCHHSSQVLLEPGYGREQFAALHDQSIL